MDSLHGSHSSVIIALILIFPMFFYRIISRSKEFALICLVGLFVCLFGDVGLFVFWGFCLGFVFLVG